MYDSKNRLARRRTCGSARTPSTAYLIQKASFVACHQYEFLLQTDILRYASTGAVFLLNSPFKPDEVWDKLPKKVQAKIIEKKIKFYNIDGYDVAQRTGMGTRVNTIMQTCFFAISGVLPKDDAIAKIKESIKKTYGRKGDEIVRKNFLAVDETLANLHEIPYTAVTSTIEMPPVVPPSPLNSSGSHCPHHGGRWRCPAGLQDAVDGTSSATTRWERRNVALNVPIWESECISAAPLLCVPPRMHPLQRIRQGPARQGPGQLQARPRAQQAGQSLHPASLCRRLHRLRRVRGVLPQETQGRPHPQGHQPRPQTAD